MKRFLAIFLITFLIACSQNFEQKSEKIFIDNGNKLIMLNVQIADDNNEREQGLMLRESLAEDEGMLFVFDDLNYRSFWMKNTLIPLDMIFIGKDLKIVGIKSAYPCKADPCEIYNSGKPAMYVLETNAGFAEMNGIDEGDKIIANNKYLNKPSAQNG